MYKRQLYDSSEFRLLQRVLREQTESTPNGPKAKDKAQIKTDSLQNPSDPDATYRKKAGKDHKGYTANIVELSPNEGPNYITHYDLKPKMCIRDSCYTALLVYRLLECQLDDNGTHVTTDHLIATLKNMNVVNIHDVQYLSLIHI